MLDPARRARTTGRMALALCALALAVALLAAAAQPAGATRVAGASAELEQCVTADQAEARSATFVGEMTAVPGTARMEMRIDLLERLPRALLFHTVTAPGLGVWRSASSGVKVYRYVKQVANLSAPATYRGEIRFRWLNAKGRVIRALALRTASCVQPATPTPPAEPTTAAS